MVLIIGLWATEKNKPHNNNKINQTPKKFD